MTIQQDSDHEFVEVKVSKRKDTHLSPDGLAMALQQRANALAATKQQVDTRIVFRLSQMTQLGHQLKSDLPEGGAS